MSTGSLDTESENDSELNLEQALQVLTECERHQDGITIRWWNGGDLIATGQIGVALQENTVTFHKTRGHEKVVFRGDDAKLILNG